MNEQEELLASIIAKLESFDIPFMITGSLASSAYGTPRSTNDIDIVIDPRESDLRNFVLSFDDRYYAELSMALDAFRSRGMFNIIDTSTGWKVDFILAKKSAYSQSALNRRQKVSVLNTVPAYTVSPEDIILIKLKWAKISESERHLRDAFGVVAMSEHLDREYLTEWARELNILDSLNDLLREGNKLAGEEKIE